MLQSLSLHVLMQFDFGAPQLHCIEKRTSCYTMAWTRIAGFTHCKSITILPLKDVTEFNLLVSGTLPLNTLQLQ